MHGFIIVTVIYLLSKMNMHGMDSTSMAKQALGHLHFMVNGLRSTSSTAPDKNMNFTNDPKAEKWLVETSWEEIQAKIETVSNFRYLGPTFQRLWIAGVRL